MSTNKLVYRKPEGKYAEHLKRYFVTKFRSAYVQCDNVLLPEYFTQFGDRIRDMDVRSDDIWVCSFPKTGTTWTQEMVWCIANDVDLKAAEEIIPQRFPYLEQTPFFDYRDIIGTHPEETFPEREIDSVGCIDEMPSRRFIQTHLPFHLLPRKLQRNEKNTKIVYVSRNARDTCVSHYHYSRLFEGYCGNFEQFLELFIEGYVCYAPYWDHVLGFWQQRNNLNMLIIKYEDMKKDLKSMIYKTADFLGKTLNDDQVAKLLDHLSFQKMKDNRAVNYASLIELNKKYRLIDEDGSFIRNGQIGDWKKFMNVEQMKRFADWEKENLKNTGLDYDM